MDWLCDVVVGTLLLKLVLVIAVVEEIVSFVVVLSREVTGLGKS